jgi:hypothetical protein
MGDLQHDLMPTMEAEASGEQNRVITPAVADTIQNAVTMLPTVNLPAATQVGAGQTGGAFATIATGDLAVAQVPTCPFNLSVHSFTAPPVDQRAGLGSWQLRKRVAVASTTIEALDILCPFELLSFGDVGATVRAQRMPFEAFAYSRGTVEIGIDLRDRALTLVALLASKFQYRTSKALLLLFYGKLFQTQFGLGLVVLIVTSSRWNSNMTRLPLATSPEWTSLRLMRTIGDL